MDKKPGHGTDEKAISPGEQPRAVEETAHQQKQKTPKKEPSPLEIAQAELYDNVFYHGGSRIQELQEKVTRLYREKQQAEKLAQTRADEERKVMSEDLTDQEDDDEFTDEDDEFTDEEQSKPEPDQIIEIKIGESPAKTAGLEMKDLIRRGRAIEFARYVSPDDGVIHQFRGSVDFEFLYGPFSNL
jgi:hypothetical protein